jgi:glycine/D-amino acid oxidase-like deaminating enzyme
MQNQHVSDLRNLAGPAALHGPQSYWTSMDHPPFHVLKTPRSRSYDVIIVGAGLSGAMIAERITDNKRSVLVIDRRMPLASTTATSKAAVQVELELSLSDLSRQTGLQEAERIWKRSAQGVQGILDLGARLRIDFGLEKRRLLHLALPQSDPAKMIEEAELRMAAGIDTTFLGPEDLLDNFGIDRPGGLLCEAAAVVNPVQLAAVLFREATKRGAEVSAHLEVIDVRESGGLVHLLTSDGDFLSASQVIFSTGYELPLSAALPSQPHASTWAIATQPGLAIPEWLGNHVVEEAEHTGLHIRTTLDGRILAGMEDEAEAFPSLLPERHDIRSRMLADRLSQLLGMDVGEPDYAWCGVVGRRPTGLPLIGRLPQLEQVYAVTGLSAGGINLAQVAADILARAINGEPDDDAELFAFPSEDVQQGRLHA